MYPSIIIIPPTNDSGPKLLTNSTFQLYNNMTILLNLHFTFKPAQCSVILIKIPFLLLKGGVTHLPFLCSSAWCWTDWSFHQIVHCHHVPTKLGTILVPFIMWYHWWQPPFDMQFACFICIIMTTMSIAWWIECMDILTDPTGVCPVIISKWSEIGPLYSTLQSSLYNRYSWLVVLNYNCKHNLAWFWKLWEIGVARI